MSIDYYTYRFSELFYPLEKGSYRLTEQAAYNSLKYKSEMVPLWGGQQSHIVENQFISIKGKTLHNKDIKIFDGGCLIISLDGSAGSITYKPERIDGKEIKFALNHHAGVLRCRDNSILDIEYFKYRFEGFMKSLAVSEGSKTLTVGTLDRQIFEIPKIDIQREILKKYKKLDGVKSFLINQLELISKIKSKVLESSHIDNINETIQLNEIMSYKSRNDSLSIEGIYNFSPKTITEDCITVLSGSSINKYYGRIRSSASKIHSLKDKQALHLITRGKAGQLTYLPKGHYATNTNAFLLYLKEEKLNDLNIANENHEKIYLKFLRIYLGPIFVDISSKSDVSVFPLNKVFKELVILRFKYSSDLERIVNSYEKLEHFETTILKNIDKINNIFSKDVIS